MFIQLYVFILLLICGFFKEKDALAIHFYYNTYHWHKKANCWFRVTDITLAQFYPFDSR